VIFCTPTPLESSSILVISTVVAELAMSNRRKRGVKMSNLWFLWFLQECYENSCNLELAHAHSGQLRGESLTEAVWTLIELCLTRAWVDIQAKSEPVGVQDNRLYDGASPGTTQASWCCSAESGGRQELSRARYPVCKRSSRLMSMIARESFVR